ncbi:MAG: hypothetical protein V4729_03160 [Pseudomonadota bacterium]
MAAFIVATGILMWIWTSASRSAVGALLPVAAGPARSGWLALAVAIGGSLLVAMAQLLLPASVLSQGWSRETLQAAQQGALAVVLVLGGVGLWLGHLALSPAMTRPAVRAAKRRP